MYVFMHVCMYVGAHAFTYVLQAKLKSVASYTNVCENRNYFIHIIILRENQTR